MQHLIIVQPFLSWRVGEVVDDGKKIEAILGSEHADRVVRINPPKEN